MHSYKTPWGGGGNPGVVLLYLQNHISINNVQAFGSYLLFFHAEIHVYFVRKSTKSTDIIAVLTTQHLVLDYPSEYRYNNDGPMENLATN